MKKIILKIFFFVLIPTNLTASIKPTSFSFDLSENWQTLQDAQRLGIKVQQIINDQDTKTSADMLMFARADEQHQQSLLCFVMTQKIINTELAEMQKEMAKRWNLRITDEKNSPTTRLNQLSQQETAILKQLKKHKNLIALANLHGTELVHYYPQIKRDFTIQKRK
jgi:hypothetical protein